MTPEDRDAIVRTVYGEARGEPPEGKIAVIHVILNRAAIGGWWGSTPYDVCHHKWQFSCWNANDPNSAKLPLLHRDDPSYMYIDNLVGHILALPDPTHGATHYKVRGTKASWDNAVKDQYPVSIGHHDFFTLPS